MATPTTPAQHVSELHSLNQKVKDSFQHLHNEIDAHLHPPPRVREALAAHGKAVQEALSASTAKTTELSAASAPALEKQGGY